MLGTLEHSIQIICPWKFEEEEKKTTTVNMLVVEDSEGFNFSACH